MRALVKTGPGVGLEMRDVPRPEAGPGEVLIRVGKTAICGTDVHIWNWDDWAAATVPAPMVVGHEFCGVVEETGAGVRSVKPGDRVAGEGHLVCGICRNCRAGREHLCIATRGVGVHRAGAFAEFLLLPEHNVYPVPDGVPDEIVALFDPLGNAVHTALSFDLVGEDVLVTGAGPIGIMGALVAQRGGARNVAITDINPVRLELAERLGVRHLIDASRETPSEAMPRLGLHEGFDVGLEMSGAPSAFRGMIEAMNHGGKIAILGIPARPFEIDWTPVIFKMLTLKGIYGREMFDTWYKMIALVEGGLDLTGLITHRLPAARFAEGFEAMRSGEAGKVVLDWG